MQFADWLLIAVIVLAAFLAIRSIYKRRGSCCGDCASCRRHCSPQDRTDKI